MSPDASRDQGSDDPLTVAPPQPVNAVAKVCAILRTLGAKSPQRLSEIAATTGLNKVTALRIIDTLIAEGFVARASDGRQGYGRGREWLVQATEARASLDLRELARPSLIRLAELSEDTTLLSVRSGLEAVCIDRQIGSFPIRANYLDLGSRRPLGVGAGSLALLAWLGDREIEAVLAANEARLAAYPALSVATIRREIVASRRQGYVFLLDRVVPKMGAIGIPLLDGQGQVVAAISVAALSERLLERRERLRDALVDERDRILGELRRNDA